MGGIVSWIGGTRLEKKEREREKVSLAPACISASRLWVPCDKSPHAPVMTEHNFKHKSQETFPPVSGFMSAFCQASRNVTNAEMSFPFFF